MRGCTAASLHLYFCIALAYICLYQRTWPDMRCNWALCRKLEAAKANRKDAKLKGVIIREKWDKKFSEKFSTPSVPFPFDSRETYDRSMRQPLGRDFNTDAVFRSVSLPACALPDIAESAR